MLEWARPVCSARTLRWKQDVKSVNIYINKNMGHLRYVTPPRRLPDFRLDI